MTRACRLLLIGQFAATFIFAADPIRTVILVRHAERGPGIDAQVPLIEAGRCRATVLAGMLADLNVSSIYTTEAVRTQQTAEPLAQKLGLRPTVIASNDVDSVVAKLRATPPGKNVLVVGHSSTVPEIVKRLSGEVFRIADPEYDHMFIVTLIGPNEARVLDLRYPGCSN
jgi:phosphohistidine phosphatase SixA